MRIAIADMKHRTPAAFTLIELLVVIAIIAILAAMLPGSSPTTTILTTLTITGWMAATSFSAMGMQNGLLGSVTRSCSRWALRKATIRC